MPGGVARSRFVFLELAARDQSHSHQFVNMLSWVFSQKCQSVLSSTKRFKQLKINYFQNRDGQSTLASGDLSSSGLHTEPRLRCCQRQRAEGQTPEDGQGPPEGHCLCFCSCGFCFFALPEKPRLDSGGLVAPG